MLGYGYGAAVAVALLRKSPERIMRSVLCGPIAPTAAQAPTNFESHFRRMFSSAFMTKYEDRYDLLLARYNDPDDKR